MFVTVLLSGWRSRRLSGTDESITMKAKGGAVKVSAFFQFSYSDERYSSELRELQISLRTLRKLSVRCVPLFANFQLPKHTNMKRITLSLTFSIFTMIGFNSYAQEGLNYQVPPQEILELVKVDRAPSVLMDSKKQVLVFLYSSMYKTIEEVSEQELKLAGLRINPKVNNTSGARYYTKISIQLPKTTAPVFVKGLPENMRVTNVMWSPDEQYLACTNIVSNGLELWVIDVKNQQARKISGANLNGNLGTPFQWFRDSKSLLVHVLPANRRAFSDAAITVPTGPSVSVSEGGSKAQNRTYQDLLKSKIDEQNFEVLATSELHKINIDGTSSLWLAADMYSRENISPDGNYILVTTIKRPFSYIVTYSSFPATTTIYDLSGKMIRIFDEKPLVDNLPKGFMAVQKGKRQFAWRADQPATIYWIEALDGGDPAVEVPFRDEVFTWEAPFADNSWKSLVKIPQRYGGLLWGRNDMAIVYDSWYNTRNEKTYLLDPSNPSKGLTLLFDRNSQDEYANPGDFDVERNEYGRYVLRLEGSSAYMIGEGFTEKGQFPFVNEYNLQTKKTTTLYRSAYTDKLEVITAVIDPKKGEYLVRIESPTEYPNYYRRSKGGKTLTQITSFANPFSKIAGISKEVITYKRADGLELTATLYLPAGYDKTKKEKLPMVMWAYPQEFKDKNSASQNTTNPNGFIFPNYGSPIYWVTRGYAVLDNASFPIVGEGTTEPNDSFIQQLVANAKAAIDAVDSLGYIDRRKVAVGGHSYGAFMTANLLTHSDLFAAGIARSGAYNRSLTPFGFQGEERNYWEAQDTYNEMSPFNYVEKMKTPLLLVHGENDNNPGTFPIQSERYFAALKGFGAPVRLVVLPKESHGYAAIESILHLLWEQDQWLEKYVKNRPVTN
jgi:dipeptidyl aminopeptidase/acylaminoacyl peptidase